MTERGKKRKTNIQKVEYVENEKRFLDLNNLRMLDGFLAKYCF